MVIIARAIIRHLGREVRAIRDLLITYLSIKDTNKKSAKTAVKTIMVQVKLNHINRYYIVIVIKNEEMKKNAGQ